MARTRWAMAAAIAALLFTILPAHADPSADIRSQSFSMHETDLRYATAEPSIALDSKDHVFVCGPVGIPGGQFTYNRSTDWTNFDHSTLTNRGGGGDCDIATGPNATGDSVYIANLQAWASAINVSTDDGVTMKSCVAAVTAACVPIEDAVEQDRMWLATDPTVNGVVYLGYHDFTGDAIVVAKSTDGGNSWLQHTVASSDPAVAIEGLRNTGSPGRVRVDPTNHNRVYIEWTRSTVEQKAGNLQQQNAFAPGNQILVARSDDGGLTWSDSIAIDAPVGSVLPNVIPWMAVDLAGNVYVTAAGTINGVNGLFYVSSTDHGATWTQPFKVNTGDGAVIFPTVIAGKNGVADFTWVQSSATTTADTTGVWNVHFAQTRNALDASPTFAGAQGPVVHKGEVCTKGLLCVGGGDRSLLDFMDMALDHFGYAHIVVYSTEKGGDCALTCPAGQVGTPHVLYWRQDAGASATTEPEEGGIITARPGPR